LIETAEDVLAVIKPLMDRAPRPAPRSRCAAAAPKKQRPKASGEKPANPTTSLADRLLGLLGAESLPVDELIRQCQAGAAEIQETLVELELAGAVERQPGNRIARGSG
ncbi:MAG: hypothetical protein AAFY56_20375, partial [Pseudomonadota bacterium]